MMPLSPRLRMGMFYTLLGVGAVAMLLPFWVMLATALSDPQAVFAAETPILWPWPLQWDNFERLMALVPMGQYFINSVFVASVTTIIHVFLCAMAAYGFSRLHMPYKNAVFMVFLITLMIPPYVNLVPLFFMMKTFGWMDTYWALIVPGLFGAFGVFLLRQWFNGLPRELEEAAQLDGCNPAGIFWRIALPLARPALAALAIFVFIGSWNSLMWPLIVTHSEGLRTLPVGIAALKGSYRDVTDWTILMAASTVAVVPVIGMFLLGQRVFIQGLLMGGVKE